MFLVYIEAVCVLFFTPFQDALPHGQQRHRSAAVLEVDATSVGSTRQQSVASRRDLGRYFFMNNSVAKLLCIPCFTVL